MAESVSLIPMERVISSVVLVRNHKVLMDSDLAEMYGVETKYLVRAFLRNLNRFPSDFAFQLSQQEWESLRCQIGTSKELSRGGRRYAPYVFTEQGVAMLSSVLKSKRAVQVNIAIMRAFVELREMLGSHKDLARKLEAMEKKYDSQFKIVFDAIRELMKPPETPARRKIGFVVE